MKLALIKWLPMNSPKLQDNIEKQVLAMFPTGEVITCTFAHDNQGYAHMAVSIKTDDEHYLHALYELTDFKKWLPLTNILP